MNPDHGSRNKIIMKTLNTLLLTSALLASVQGMADHLQAHLAFSAKLDGAQEVPQVMTNAQGVASLTLNSTRDTLCIRGNFTGLSGSIMGAHIHDGVAGTNGPVLIDLTSSVMGNQLSATITGASITPSIIAAHVEGSLYLNIHTAANPNGEIRGQIIPETDMAFVADLNGMNEVPMAATNAVGLGTFLLAKHQGELQYRVVLNDLTGPIQAAHLHMGAAGTNGPVVLDLTPDISGNTIAGSADPTMFLADLMAGDIYLNVHTTMFPNGEVRAQLLTQPGIPFDSWLDGAQEVPAVTTNAMGVASIILSSDLDSLYYDVLIDGLSGAIQASHLHLGEFGSNGAVAVDISSGISGNRISGSVATMGVSDPLLTDMLEGGVYINVHTMMNPNGEVRGQVYRYMREGYTVQIDAAQEVPSNNSMATGGGIVTVDRDQTNAHIMYVSDADMVTATHLHVGEMGVNGPVVYNLTPFWMNNGVFTYWTGMDMTTPFVLQNSVQLRNDSLYVNVHTTPFPNGEIRGQVLRGSPCSMLSTGVFEELPEINELEAYPVPTFDLVTVTTDFDPRAADIRLVNNLGVEIQASIQERAENKLTLDMSGMPGGTYTMIISDEKTISRARLIKK